MEQSTSRKTASGVVTTVDNKEARAALFPNSRIWADMWFEHKIQTDMR